MAQRGRIPAQPGRRKGAAGRRAARRLAEELPALRARARRLLCISPRALPLKAARMRRGAVLLPSGVPRFHSHPYPTPHVSLRVWRHRGGVPIPAPPPPSPPTGRLCKAYAASPARPHGTHPLPLPQRRLQNCQVRGHSEAACSLFATQCLFVRLELFSPSGLEPCLSSPVPARTEAPSSEAAARRQLPLVLPRGFRNHRSPSRARCRLSDSCSLPSPGIKHVLLTVPSLLGRWAAGQKWKGGEECIN